MASMAYIDRDRLQTDLEYRVAFSRDFIEFTDDDVAILHGVAPLMLPVITDIVEGVYEHLFEFSYTKEAFLKRPTDLDDSSPTVRDITQLSLESPQMKLRKNMLTHWLAKVLASDFNKMDVWDFMDRVGVMHTGQPSFTHRLNKEPLHVDLHALSLTLGWIQSIIITIVMEFPRDVLSTHKKTQVLQAFNKLFFLQQDLFQRHYVRSDEEAAVHLAKVQQAARDKLLAEKVEEVKADDSAHWGKGRREDSSDEEGDGGGRGREEAREAVAGLPEVGL